MPVLHMKRTNEGEIVMKKCMTKMMICVALTGLMLPGCGSDREADSSSMIYSSAPDFPGADKFGEGKVNDHILQLGQQLVKRGYGKHYKVGPSRDWGEADRLNVRDFQLAQGWTGADADGYPGPTTWKRLFEVNGSDPKPRGTLTRTLYSQDDLSSKLTCGFNGYKTVAGKHEGLDFAFGNGKKIYALISGRVINVVEGKAGTTKRGADKTKACGANATEGQLSTIAIYDESQDKTVVYLHANPSVKIGDDVIAGVTQVGNEDWRGAGCAISSTHTHVEVVNGKSMLAMKSGDDVLKNDDPRSYWNSKGYSEY
jgi:hypothetical protein